MADLPEYLVLSKITPGLLRGLRRRFDPVPRRIFDFTMPEEHEGDDDGKIKREVAVEEADSIAQIRGYLESSIAVSHAKIEMQRIGPFHVREHVPFTIDHEGVRRAGDTFEIASEAVADAVGTLEPRRRDLALYSLLSMVDNEQFAYRNGDGKVIIIPYGDWILDLGSSSDTVGGGSFDAYPEMRSAKDAYAAENDRPPNQALINSFTAGEMLKNADIKNVHKPIQPSDPERVAYRQFDWDGVRWNVLYHRYEDEDGNKHKPISDYKAVMFSSAEGMPFQLHRVENTANAQNASEPFLDQLTVENNPWEGIVRLYDNFIPGITERHAVGTFDMS